MTSFLGRLQDLDGRQDMKAPKAMRLANRFAGKPAKDCGLNQVRAFRTTLERVGDAD